MKERKRKILFFLKESRKMQRITSETTLLVMRFRLFLLGALLALLSGSLTWAGPKPVELSLSSKTLSPTTTFEMHFLEPMVRQEVVGKPDQRSPLVFRPALKGTFTWLDQHRGNFEPTEPMPLNTTYTLSLRKGLTKADGQPFREPWSETVSTPPMQLQWVRTASYIERQNATAKPGIVLCFDSNVAAKSAVASLRFVDSNGVEIPVQAKTPAIDYYGTMIFQQEGGALGSNLPWREQCRGAKLRPERQTYRRAFLETARGARLDEEHR
jgi:hypothetical protein